MPYNPKGEIRDHWRRIAANLVNFRGRSRRSELAAYWVFMLIINMLSLLASLAIPAVAERDLEWLQFALTIPLIPMLARRLHDQNRPAWITLIVPVLMGLHAYAYWLFKAGRIPIPKLGYPLNILEGSLTLVIFAIILWPGTDGPNRFGNDPRLEA